MNCAQWDRQLSRWLEGRWGRDSQPGTPPRRLTRHVSECPRCARKLDAAEVLVEARRLRTEVPPGLDERILTRLRSARAPRAATWGGLGTAARVLLPAAAVILLAVTAFLALRAPAVPETDRSVRVLLVLEAPEAGEVSVVGDWNAWDPQANPLDDTDGDGVWRAEIQVHPGAELRYQFLIDGRTWIPDPGAPFQVDDGFGGKASVLQI